MANHALLSPSSARVWLMCPASARMAASMPKYANPESLYMREGTFAHELAELRLKSLLRGLNKDYYSMRRDLFEEIRAAGLDPVEMEHTVNTEYADKVFEDYKEIKASDPEAVLLIEQKVVTSIPNCWGYIDAMILSKNLAHIYDFKYGVGCEVYAPRNYQTIIYSLGAIHTFKERDIQDVYTHIIQPRALIVSMTHRTREELYEWASKVLGPAAKKANRHEIYGEPERPQPIKGEWCRYCKAAALCPEYINKALTITTSMDGIADLAEYPRLVDTLLSVEKWAKDFRALVENHFADGKEVDGYKLVRGAKKRVFEDKAKVIEVLKAKKIPASKYLKPKELRNMSDIQKLVSPEYFETHLAPLITIKENKPIIVREDDPRDEYKPRVTTFNI